MGYTEEADNIIFEFGIAVGDVLFLDRDVESRHRIEI